MKGLLYGKLKMLIRKPWPFLLTTIVCLMFAFFTSQSGANEVTVPYSTEGGGDAPKAIIEELKASDSIIFQEKSKGDLDNQVSEGKSSLGLILGDDDYTIIASADTPNVPQINQIVRKAYMKVAQQKEVEAVAAEQGIGSDEVQGWFKDVKDDPSFSLKETTFRSDGDWVYDVKLQSLFGFSLFFVIYTIAYNVATIMHEKRMGIWDRMILSPVKKWEMYTANLLYSFILGYVQILLVFMVFRYITDVNFYGHFAWVLVLLIPYVFAIVALSIFITGLVKKSQHFNAVIPIVAVSMAMLGGAYWPLEIVNSPVMIAISKVIPITYGMEILKGITVNQLGLGDILYPVSILLLMGVLFLGLGLNFMEKRHV
ncbi:ABC transporter permease [Rossellomorea marisflavi]|uniref:ABC transporter permease n=1 Tax=Rossellomorea marisflavi TaxID=189381 RepID=UPI00345992DB